MTNRPIDIGTEVLADLGAFGFVVLLSLVLPAVELYRVLFGQHSHIDFLELLTAKALEVLYYIDQQRNRLRDSQPERQSPQHGQPRPQAVS